MAAGLGVEPRLTESESAVLPLDDPAVKEGARKSVSQEGLGTPNGI